MHSIPKNLIYFKIYESTVRVEVNSSCSVFGLIVSKSIGLAGGVAHARVVEPPDWVLDYWHPLEKAQYPQYFECREKRKEEYMKHWSDGTLM